MRIVPSLNVAVIVMCSFVTWVSGSIRSVRLPQWTSACTPPTSTAHSLLVRGSGAKKSAG